MEYQGRTLCITEEDVSAVLSSGTLYKLCQRGQVRRVRRACKDTPALYDLESFPLRYKIQIYERYPDALEREQSKTFMQEIEWDSDAAQYYLQYEFADGSHIAEDKQREYTANCSVLNAFDKKIRTADEVRLKQAQPKLPRGEFWSRAAAALPRIADAGWAHNLPSNPRSLQRKYNIYKKEGYASMIKGVQGNKHASKVTTEEQEAVLLHLLSLYLNINNETIAQEYNKVAKVMEWKTITADAVAIYRRRLSQVAELGSLGETKYRAARNMQVKRSRPSAAFLMWSLDGWTVELLFRRSTTNKKGQSVTTYHHRLTMVVVLDPCCDYPIGYAVGEHESKALIKAALRNAAEHSRELFGDMYRAHQLQSDHYGLDAKLLGDLGSLYRIVGEKVTPARVRNAKAKPVERYFAHLNTTYCQRCANWGGYGITTDPDKQPNPDALNKIRKNFPDEQGVRAQIDAMMQAERAAKREAFFSAFEKLSAGRRLPLSRESFLLAFGEETGRTNRLQACGLCPTIEGVRREYDSFDASFRDHRGEDWRVLYDPRDLSTVLAVNESGTRRYVLEEKYVQPMALADRQEGDAEQLQRVFDFNRDLEERAGQKIIAARQKVEVMINSHEQIKGLLGRMLLTDSRGNHKDNRSAELAMSAVDIEDDQVQEISDEEDLWSRF